MNLDATFQLPCPDTTDAAALALYMQRLAFAVEGELVDQRTRIRKAYRPPCAVWRSTSTSGPITSSGFSQLLLDRNALVFNNYDLGTVPGFTILPEIGRSNKTFSEAGEWTIGMSAKMTETGAVSFGTERKIQAIVYQVTPNGEVIKGRMDRTCITNHTDANEWLTVSGTFTIGDDFQNWYWQGLFTHTNAASTVQITAGDLIVWAYKLSSADQIEVT